MILTVTLNAALDVTYTVERLHPHRTHRVQQVRQRAGGKGINVARVLRALGQPTVVTGLAGGRTGEAIREDLAVAGLPDELVPVAGESRRTVAVVSTQDGDATLFNEPGPRITETEWQRFLDRFVELATTAEVVVLSGSLPPGVPDDGYAHLVRIAAGLGSRTIVDAEGEPLRRAVAAGPDLVKPNAAELRATTGLDDPLDAAHRLQLAGARAVVVSLGADGLLAVDDEIWRAEPPEQLYGNPTGAGDACVAALATGLRGGTGWPELLRAATALSAAAVRCPLAGEFDEPTRRDLHTRVRVQQVDRTVSLP